MKVEDVDSLDSVEGCCSWSRLVWIDGRGSHSPCLAPGVGSKGETSGDAAICDSPALLLYILLLHCTGNAEPVRLNKRCLRRR